MIAFVVPAPVAIPRLKGRIMFRAAFLLWAFGMSALAVAQDRPTLVLMPPTWYNLDRTIIGLDVYYPIAGLSTVPVKGGVMIGSGAICKGKYTGFPSAAGFSLKARAVGLTVMNIATRNRSQNFDVLVLNRCHFGRIDEATYGKSFSIEKKVDQRPAQEIKPKQESATQEELNRAELRCALRLAEQGREVTAENKRLYCNQGGK